MLPDVGAGDSAALSRGGLSSGDLWHGFIRCDGDGCVGTRVRNTCRGREPISVGVGPGRMEREVVHTTGEQDDVFGSKTEAMSFRTTNVAARSQFPNRRPESQPPY